MKKLFVYTILLLSISSNIFGQIVNDGGTIIVKSNSDLYSENDIKNNAGLLRLENNSTLETKGNFISEDVANFEAQQGSTVKFFGAQSKMVKSGGDDFAKVVVSKEAADISLDDDMTIVENLEFSTGNSSKLVVGAHSLTLESNASITGADSDNYIQADGVGLVNKIYSAVGNFTFPVGDSDEYSPLEVNVKSGTFVANSSIGVNLVDEVHPNLPSESADCYISRYWHVEQSNIVGFEATLTGTYVEADVVGTCETINGTSYDGGNWRFDNSQGSNLTVIGDISNSSSDFTGVSAEALDISLIDFDVEAVGHNSCMIRWSLVYNSNIESFEVQRSTDMVQWQPVGSVICKKTEKSVNKYSYLDENISDVKQYKIYYYRIKVIYFDGISEYTDVRFLNFGREANEAIVVFPNPVSNVLYYDLPEKIRGCVSDIMLVDSKGVVVLHSKSNDNSNTLTGMLDFTSYDIPNGLYFLLVIDDYGNVYKHKVLINGK